jgi:hypothetical protein
MSIVNGAEALVKQLRATAAGQYGKIVSRFFRLGCSLLPKREGSRAEQPCCVPRLARGINEFTPAQFPPGNLASRVLVPYISERLRSRAPAAANLDRLRRADRQKRKTTPFPLPISPFSSVSRPIAAPPTASTRSVLPATGAAACWT